MAGSSMTITETNYHGSMKKVKAEWVSDDTDGSVSGITSNYYDGQIWGAVTDPGSTAPADNYDITVLDSDSVDVALGALANRDTSNTEVVTYASMAGVAGSRLTISVANAGNSKIGTIYLYIR